MFVCAETIRMGARFLLRIVLCTHRGGHGSVAGTLGGPQAHGDADQHHRAGDPWLSMRLEAERRGTEDLKLLRLLRERNPYLHNRLITQVFRSNSDYTDDEALFDDVYRQVLEALAK